MTNKTEDKFYFLRPGQIARDNDLMRHHRRMLVDAIIRARDVGLIDIPEFKAAVAAMNDQSSIPNHKLANLERALTKAIKEEGFSRPGQPDKFDASSLDRGNFAEASKSPMLGKLLSEKAMPEGGWRAVQVGSDTLVISFEDADLARDFGRRAASKGYSATSPVATTGRYWNVEVKNGK